MGPALPLACMALGLLLIVGQAPAAAAKYGRVSHIDGDLMLRGVYDDDWGFAGLNTTLREGDALWTDADSLAELELGRGIFVRIGYGTELYIDELPEDAEVRLVSGSVYVSRDYRDGYMRVTTPTTEVRVRKGSIVRVDVAEDGSSRISTFRGSATLDTEGTRLSDVGIGWRAYVYPGEGPSGWERIGRGDKDDFDEFNREREEYFKDIELPPYVDDDLVGAYDLHRHGTWITVDYVRYWRPNYRPYRPYHHGRWGWLYGGGWSWCDRYPYGYVTGHYGRWHWHNQHGWLWRPGHVWGPGWVHWVTFDNYVGWVPLDPWDRPCYVSFGLSFPIGHSGYFSIGAGSCAPLSSFHLGYVHSRPFTYTTVNIIRQKNIRVVNNYITHNDYRYVDHSFGGHGHHNIGDLYRPKYRVRGPARDERGHVAGDIVRRIENPTQRDKRWTWRAGHTDLDALRRLRESRPDHDGDGPGGGHRAGDSPAQPGVRFPNVAGRDPSGWTRPQGGDRRPDVPDRPGRDAPDGAARDGRPGDSHSGDRIWRKPSDDGDDEGNRRGPGVRPGWPGGEPAARPGGDDGHRAEEPTPPSGDRIWRRPSDDNDGGDNGRGVHTARPERPATPGSVERRPEERASRARELFEQWRNRRSGTPNPPAERTEPERRIPNPFSRNSAGRDADRPPAAATRPAPATQPMPPAVERRPEDRSSRSRELFEQWRSRRSGSGTPAPSAERPEPERRIPSPFSRNSAGRDSEGPREPVRVQPARLSTPPAGEQPSRSSTWDRLRERLRSSSRVESRPATPPERTIAPAPPRTEPRTHVWTKPAPSAPERSVTPARPTRTPQPRDSSGSRTGSIFGGRSKSTESERPATRSWGGRSSSETSSSSGRSSLFSRRSTSGTSSSDARKSSGSSGKSSSSKHGWGSRRSSR